MFWHQCSPTQQLMTSLGLPHPFSNASPPNPPPLPAVPACNPDLISSYLSHHSETSCPNLCWGSFFGAPHSLAESTPPIYVLTGTFVPSPRHSGTGGLCRRGATPIPEVAPSSQWGGFQAWVVCCLSVSDFAAPEAMALPLQAQAQESLGSQQIINNTLVTPPATC